MTIFGSSCRLGEVVVTPRAVGSVWPSSTLSAGVEEDKGGLATFGDGGDDRAVS